MRARVSYRRRSGGYVLVVTLGLLVLAVSLMVALGRGAMRHATAARLAADELQHRWGIVTCRQAVLPYAESVLLAAEAERRVATPVYREVVQLGGERFELAIADELAKANVNQLLDRTDRATAETRLRQALSGTGMSMNVRLRPGSAALVGPATAPTMGPATAPASQPAGGAALPQWISGFGQVFEDASPDRLQAIQGGQRASDLLTCWGAGVINIRRISPEALRIAGGSLTLIDQNRLLQMRDLLLEGKPLPKPPKGRQETNLILRLAQAGGVDTKNLSKAPAFTGLSTCHSIWITTRDQRNVGHCLSILDEKEKEHPRTWAFVW